MCGVGSWIPPPPPYTCTSSALTLTQFSLTILAQFLPILFSTNPIHAVPINEELIPISVQTYFSFHGYWLKMVLNTETSLSPTTKTYLYNRICLTINKSVHYQHLLVSFQELLSLRLSDHFAFVVGCINNNWWNCLILTELSGWENSFLLLFLNFLFIYLFIFYEIIVQYKCLKERGFFFFFYYLTRLQSQKSQLWSFLAVRVLALSRPEVSASSYKQRTRRERGERRKKNMYSQFRKTARCLDERSSKLGLFKSHDQ